MTPEQNYIAINRKSWNDRVAAHLASDFYDMPHFLAGKSSLNAIELNLLGNVAGKSILHLQCHFGQDSISLARMGAQVTGVDLSDKAIEIAQALAIQTQTDATFICCDLYDLPQHLHQTFDIVFTSYGTIGWLPDLNKWANIVSRFLKPQGQFVLVEFHPVVWMFDYDFEKVAYRYFNSGAIVETLEGTYADKSAALSNTEVSWNHSLGEVFSSLLSHGLQISSFEEFDYSPYNCFNKTIQVAPQQFRIAHLADKIPMVYALGAVRNSPWSMVHSR